MRIACFFTGRSTFGGAERRIGRIMNGVAAKGVEVVFVFTLFEPIEKIVEAYNQAIGYECHIRFLGFNTGLEVFNYVRKSKFDLVFYVGAFRKMLPFFLGAKLSGTRTALLQVSTGPSVGQFKTFLERIEFEFVAGNSTYIDCLYPSTTDYFRKKYKRQIVSTTPCPSTDLGRFVPQPKTKTIAFISRWVKGKNVELCVESMLKIENELYHEGYKILLCGKSNDGSIEANIKKLLKTARHPEIIEMPGYVNSEDILPEAEIFLSLQNINNYPSQSLLEAIACGCYIIASDEGDTRILVKPEFGSCCSLDSDDIAHEIIKYITMNNDEKNEMSQAARKFAESHFDLNNSIEHYLNIIKADTD